MSTNLVTPHSTLVVRPLHQADQGKLGDLFVRLAGDAESRHFHPHPLTLAEAKRLTSRLRTMKDRYFGAFEGEQLLGYAMLRGWDEGYAVPAFGVAVRPDSRGRGIGRMLLQYAVKAARHAGARKMMLKVHGENPHARRLYESEGFVFNEPPMDDGQVKGVLDL